MQSQRNLGHLPCILLLLLWLVGCGGENSQDPQSSNSPLPTSSDPIRHYDLGAVNNSNWPAQDFSAAMAELESKINATAGEKWRFSVTIHQDGGSYPYQFISQPTCPDPYASDQGVHLGNVAYCGYALSSSRTPKNTAWHEIVEMLAGRECVDPGAAYLYFFVFPNYYIPGSQGPWDNLNKCPGPNQPAPGGF